MTMNVFVLFYREPGVREFCGVFASRKTAEDAAARLADDPRCLPRDSYTHIVECELGDLITGFLDYP